MREKTKYLSGILLLFTLAMLACVVPPNEMPLGADMLSDFSDSSLYNLRHDLGFNLIKEFVQSPEILARLNNHRIQLVAGSLMTGSYTPERMSYAHYMKLEVGTSNPSPEDTFFSLGTGAYFTESTWVSTAADTLIGFDTKHYPPNQPHVPYVRPCAEIDRHYEGNYLEQAVITWNLALCLKIDVLGNSTDTVARIEGWPAPCWADSMPSAPNSDWTVLNIGTITADSFEQANSYETLTFRFAIPETVRYRHDGVAKYMVLPDTEPNGGTVGFNLRLYTTGERTVTIDWIRLSEIWGERLMANDQQIISGINSFLNQYNNGPGQCAINSFYLRDEPIWSNYQPFGKIDSLIRAVNSAWRHHTIMSNTNMARSYMLWSDADCFNIDYYPLSPRSGYTGWFEDENGLQNRLAFMSTRLYEARWKSRAMGRQFWLTPQAFWEINCGDTCKWRKPTAAELWCMTSIAFCYGVEGLLYWKYDPNGGDGQFPGFRVRQGDSLVPTNLYYKMKADINPYIKAIDSLYLAINPRTSWRRAYAYNPAFGYNPPAEALVQSISAVNIEPGDNPDLGWFHVGEFSDEYGAKYIMLVNRACSGGVNDSTEAPAIRATVRLKPETIGSDYALVIDLAKGTSFNDWVGHPETTYTAILDGALPYSTELRAGEGRLYKVAIINSTGRPR